MKSFPLPHSIFPRVRSMTLLRVTAVISIIMGHLPAKAAIGECDPRDAYCTADGQWGWPSNGGTPNEPGTKNEEPPPGKDSSSSSDYPGGEYKNHSQGWGQDENAPAGSPGDGRTASKPAPPTSFQRALAIRQKAGLSAKKTIRPAGPCFNHGLIPGITKTLPKGAHLYFGFDLSDKAPGANSQLLRAVFLLILDNANQYFGSQPATTLAGQTMVDQHPGATPLNYQFSYFDTLDAAKNAAASDPAANKFVIPITDEYSPLPSGRDAEYKIAAAETWTDDRTGELTPKHLYVNFTVFDILRQMAAEQFSGTALDMVTKRATFLRFVVGVRHEFGHLLGLDHQTYGESLDDDGSPMAYEGIGRSFERSDIDFQAPFSPCDAVTFASHTH